MIKFPCKCGHRFNVTDDMAGGLVQCPRCGLLADVPTLNDLANITEDGIFKIDDVSQHTDAIGIVELHEAFTRRTIDEHGREKDLRGDESHFEMIGIPREVDGVGYAPKYDPVTGELIRVIDVIEDIPAPVIPIQTGATTTVVSAAPSLGYAAGDTRKQVTTGHILLELFMPGNVVVMGFILGFFIIAIFFRSILAVESSFFNFSLQVLNVPLWLIVSHYGDVIEDMGPDNQDELPRPLRHLDIADDIWNPLIRILTAIIICYGPALVVGSPRIHLGNATDPLVLLLGIVGTFFFPAVVLTTVAGATSLNLRPDRVIGVIRRCGFGYIIAVLAFILAIVPTEFYLVGRSVLPQPLADLIPIEVNKWKIMLPLLAVCVYFGHFFCWQLGLMYRAHHADFPWILQRHIRTKRERAIIPPR